MKIRISYHDTQWPLYRQLPGNLNQQVPNTIHWKGHDFYVNQDIEECDVWIVNNILLKTESSLCPPKNTIFITGEPENVGIYDEFLLRKFHYLLTSQKRINHPHKIYAPQGHQWFVGKTYDELSNNKPKKTKDIAIFSSNLQISDSHKKRYNFICKIKERYGDRIDWYGRGLNPFEDKWDVMPKYKFVIVIENCSIPYYFTEKIMDAYLCLCHPIYAGCTNIHEYFPPSSMTLIDMDDWDKTEKTLDSILKNSDNIYNESYTFIEQARQKCLDEYNFFSIVINLIKDLKLVLGEKEKITFEVYENKNIFFKIYRKISNIFYKLKNG